MSEGSSDLKKIDYAALGQRFIEDPKMIEVASFFYSPRELVDLFYLCAQHRAGSEHVKEREEEFDRMLEQKAEERLREDIRKKKIPKRKLTEAFKEKQISNYKAELAVEILKNRKDILSKIEQKRKEIRNEIKRLESLLEKTDDEQEDKA